MSRRNYTRYLLVRHAIHSHSLVIMVHAALFIFALVASF